MRLGAEKAPRLKEFIGARVRSCPEITTIVQCVSIDRLNLLLGKKETVLHGPGYITDTLCGKSFRISARSFFQVNPVQTELLYQTAVDFAGLTGGETIIDAYCGVGTIGIIAAEKASGVLAVELNGDAVQNAIENVKLNGLKNVRVIQEDAGAFMEDMAEEGGSADVVFTDPPRAGCSRQFLSSLVQLGPKKIVYISCNPETQSRDLQYLTKHGYKVERIKPVDMFPYTRHIETVVLLSREKADDHIRFSINTEDLKKNVGGYATYGDIKAYVLEKFGLKVSSLYIAQTKDKCGIKERENYYIGEGKSKELICPPEKEKAIMDAFRHFGMLRD